MASVVVLAAACGGGSDGDSSVSEPTNRRGDPDATVVFDDDRLYWITDGERADPLVDYRTPIDREKLLAGIRWELRFDVDGDIGPVEAIDISVSRRLEINGDLMEGRTPELGIEDGTIRLADPWTARLDGDQLVLELDVGRPLSPVSLERLRRRFEEFTGIGADAESVDLAGDFTMNVSALTDIPRLPSADVNQYEVRARGSVALANGNEIEVDRTITYAARSWDDVPVELAAPCDALADQWLEQFDAQLAADGLVLFGQFAAQVELQDAASNACSREEFFDVVCAGIAERAPGATESSAWLVDRESTGCPDASEPDDTGEPPDASGGPALPDWATDLDADPTVDDVRISIVMRSASDGETGDGEAVAAGVGGDPVQVTALRPQLDISWELADVTNDGTSKQVRFTADTADGPAQLVFGVVEVAVGELEATLDQLLDAGVEDPIVIEDYEDDFGAGPTRLLTLELPGDGSTAPTYFEAFAMVIDDRRIVFGNATTFEPLSFEAYFLAETTELERLSP